MKIVIAMCRFCPLVLALWLPACGASPSPVAEYFDAVEVSLSSDGKKTFLYLKPSATPSAGCPRFGAPATIDGHEMVAFQFGGELMGLIDESSRRRCDFGAYRVPLARSARSTISKVNIADDSAQITFSVADVLTEPTLVWDGASEAARVGERVQGRDELQGRPAVLGDGASADHRRPAVRRTAALFLQRFRSADDLHQLFGDSRLSGAVISQGERVDHLLGILGG
jgi:hypothetical protein